MRLCTNVVQVYYYQVLQQSLYITKLDKGFSDLWTINDVIIHIMLYKFIIIDYVLPKFIYHEADWR